MLIVKKALRTVTIVYRRLPADLREYQGLLLAATRNRLVIQSPIEPTSPLVVLGKTIADKGFTAIWFIYRNRWYDIGKFYDKSGRWIGYYCDILKPNPSLLRNPHRTVVLTDLFLDLWITTGGRFVVLDEDELNEALVRHEISTTLAREARRRIEIIIRAAKANRFPPRSVREIELKNARLSC